MYICVRINVDDKKKTSIWKTNFNLYFYDAQEKLVNFFIWKFLLHDFDSSLEQKIYKFWKTSRTSYSSKYLDWQRDM